MSASRRQRFETVEDLRELRGEIARMWDWAPLTPIRINRKYIKFRYGWQDHRFSKPKKEKALSVRRHSDGTAIRVDSGYRRWQVKGIPLRRGVYVIACGDRVKIGKAKNVAVRLRGIRHMNGADLRLVGWFPDEYTELESRLHRALKEYRLYGEWFLGATSLLKFLDEQPGFSRDVSLDELIKILGEGRAVDGALEGGAP